MEVKPALNVLNLLYSPLPPPLCQSWHSSEITWQKGAKNPLLLLQPLVSCAVCSEMYSLGQTVLGVLDAGDAGC